jgi:hypothetical protein
MSQEITQEEAVALWAERKPVEALGHERDGWGLIAPPGSIHGRFDGSIFNREDNVFMFRLPPEPPEEKFREPTPIVFICPEHRRWRPYTQGELEGYIGVKVRHKDRKFLALITAALERSAIVGMAHYKTDDLIRFFTWPNGTVFGVEILG